MYYVTVLTPRGERTDITIFAILGLFRPLSISIYPAHSSLRFGVQYVYVHLPIYHDMVILLHEARIHIPRVTALQRVIYYVYCVRRTAIITIIL